MNYPEEFPQASRARVDAALVTAERDFARSEQGLRSSMFLRGKYQNAVEKLLNLYVIAVFFVFADEAIQLGKRGIWQAVCIRSTVEKFGGEIISIANKKCYDREGNRFASRDPFDIGFPLVVWPELTRSKQWLMFLDQLAELAQAQALAASSDSTIFEKASERGPQAIQKSSEPLVGGRPSSEVARPMAKRGPKADIKLHREIAAVVKSFGVVSDWKRHANLETIAEKIDRQKIPASRAWAKRKPPARSWTRAVALYPNVVCKALEYHLEMAAKDTPEKPSETLGNSR